MTATEKLNWKSVWLAICAISCVCRGIMKLQRRKDSISGADKMNSDTFLLGALWFLLLLLLEGSASAATVWLSFLSLSLPLCNASPRISIRLLGEGVSRMLPREETHEGSGSRDKRQEDEGGGERRAGACYTSIPKTFGERQVLSEGSFI